MAVFSSHIWATRITVKNLNSKQSDFWGAFSFNRCLDSRCSPVANWVAWKAGPAVLTPIRFIIHVTQARLRARTATDLHRSSDSSRSPSRHALALGRSLTHPRRTTPPLSHRRGKEGGKEGRKEGKKEGSREGGRRQRKSVRDAERGNFARSRQRGTLTSACTR